MRRIVASELDADLYARLTRFAQAAGTFKTRIIRIALAEFIEKHLRENAGVRERFERYTVEDEARTSTRGHLKIVK